MSLDRLRIDSHKLLLHPGRVARWLEAGDDWERARAVYPLYVEVSPSGACNHRCTFCALDYMGYKPRFLDPDVMAGRFEEMAGLGVKSVMFGGEGEPFLHRRMADMALSAADAGLDLAFTTNGVLLRPDTARAVLPRTAWVKVSLNAGTAETYARIHRTDAADFDKVVANLGHAARERQARGWNVTLGAQILLLPENASEVETLARLCRDLGLDYLVVKPYSQHSFSQTRQYEDMDYAPYLDMAERLEALSTDAFSLVFRAATMARYRRERPYDRCRAVPHFWAYVSADHGVWSCSAYLGDERFVFGSLAEESFRDIWEGPARQRNWELLRTLDISSCRSNCRMDAVNAYLAELAAPGPHANFI